MNLDSSQNRSWPQPHRRPDASALALCSAPRRAEWDAQQAANKASAYTEEGGKGGYGEVELASADRPVRLCWGQGYVQG